MKKILALFCIIASLASAAPFVATDPLPAGVTSCGFVIDTFQKINVPVTNRNGTLTCEVDVGTVSSGAHTVKFTAITGAADPIWGAQESPPSAPFTFSKPAVPPAPVVSGLKP